MEEITQEDAIQPRYESESYICNATSSSIFLYMLFQLLILFGSSIAGALILAICSAFFTGATIDDSLTDTLITIAELLGTIGGISLAVILIKNCLKIKLPPMRVMNCKMKSVLYYTALAMGLSSIFSFLVMGIDILLSGAGIHMTTPDFTMKYDLLNNLILLVSTCIVAPIFEELIFRGLILTALKKFGHVYAIVVTSLLFALLHGNIPQSLPIFFFSLVVCYVVIKMNSLLPAILIHFINNVYGVMGLYLSSNEIISNITFFIDILIMFFAIFVVVKRKNDIKTFINQHKGSTIRSYFKHVAPIVFLVFCIISIIGSFII